MKPDERARPHPVRQPPAASVRHVSTPPPGPSPVTAASLHIQPARQTTLGRNTHENAADVSPFVSGYHTGGRMSTGKGDKNPETRMSRPPKPRSGSAPRQRVNECPSLLPRPKNGTGSQFGPVPPMTRGKSIGVSDRFLLLGLRQRGLLRLVLLHLLLLQFLLFQQLVEHLPIALLQLLHALL